MYNIVKVAHRCRTFVNYLETKRYAGHSKWANIRHIKMEKDGQKQTAMLDLIKKMKIAIAEGKSAKPEDNLKLARLVEYAKKNSLPQATIKNFLEKAQSSKNNTQSVYFESRGPSGSIILIHLLTDNPPLIRNTLNTHLRKTQFSPCDLPTNSLFDQKGVVLAEVNDLSLDQAIDDAIEVGAEEAEKLKEDDKEFFQFTCNAIDVYKVRGQLEQKNYKIVSADVEYIAKVTAKLSDKELEQLSKLYERLEGVQEVVKVYNNIII